MRIGNYAGMRRVSRRIYYSLWKFTADLYLQEKMLLECSQDWGYFFRFSRHETWDRQTDRQTDASDSDALRVRIRGGSSNRRLYRLVAPSMKTFLVGFIPSISVNIWVMTRSAAADPARVTTLTQHVAGETHPVIFL